MGCKNCKNTVSPSLTIADRTKAVPTTSNDGIPIHLRNFEAENLENVTLIWLDESIDETKDDYKKTLLLLRTINDFVLTYINSKSCIEYIKSVEQEIVLLILSGSLSKDVLPYIASLRQLDSVFIFCSHRTPYDQLKLDYSSKVVDIFTKQESLIKSIRQQLHSISKQTMAFSFFNQEQKSSRDLTKEAASFLWFQLLFSVLKELPHTEDAKDEMLMKCEEYYRGNEKELKNIERFRTTYEAKDAISWYTDECFIYRLVNKALRTEDIDGLYLFRFYIIDLCRQLEKESQKNVETMTTYRGQVMSEQELDRLKHSIGSLISTNGFFSTTLLKEVAMSFLGIPSKRGELKAVLFEIAANSAVNSVTYADIEEYSRVKGEREVLFSVGAVFKIEDVDFSNEIKCWVVKMAVTDEGTKDVQVYLDSTKKEQADIYVTIIFGSLLIEMDQLTKAEKYFDLLLARTGKNSLEEADILDQQGRLFYLRSQMSLALNCYNRAYQIRNYHHDMNSPKIAGSLANIADLHLATADYEIAINHQKHALDIYQEYYLRKDHINTAGILRKLGMTYRERREFAIALDYLPQALDMQRRLLPEVHFDVANTLWDIGAVYRQQKDYDRALQYYCDALVIFEKTLPPGHQNTSKLFVAIVDAYKEKDDYEAAFNFYQKKLGEMREELGETHPAVGRILSEMGDIFLERNDDGEALPLYEKALTIFEQCNPPEQKQIWYCLNRISIIHEKRNNLQLAIDYCSRELEIGRKLDLPNHLDIGRTLYNLGRMHSRCQNYEVALKYLEEALRIFQAKCVGDLEQVRFIQNLRSLIRDFTNRNNPTITTCEKWGRQVTFKTKVK